MKRARKAPSKKAPAPATTADLLIEIGSEELPADYIASALKYLDSFVPVLLEERRITHGKVRVGGSPRRLAVIVDRVAAAQAAQSRQVRGPAKRAGLDAQGQPTPALQGFLRKHNASLKDVTWVNDYAQVTLQDASLPTAQVLTTLVPELIKTINFPKTMRWDDSGVRFARPVRWLVVLYGAQPVPVRFGRLQSGRVTYGHPATGRKAITVTSPTSYVTQLQRAHVLVDHTARRALVEQLIVGAAKKAGGVIVQAALEPGRLLDEVTHLSEDPQVIVGACDAAWLALPREVVVASMSKHQRVFAVESPDRTRLLPVFVGILDSRHTKPELDRIRRFMERILNARLSDAMDFWTQDTKTTLEAKVERLSGIVFHEKLGTVHDKAQRLVALSGWLADAWGFDAQATTRAQRVARLCKADLVRTLVKEFPSLQGVMGGYYASQSGEDTIVAQAIGQHYDPDGDSLAELVAVADWFDTLTGYFGIGIEPTGSQDPFGLRRCALGIIGMLQRTGRHVSIRQLVQRSVEAWGGRISVQPDALAVRLETFFKERLGDDTHLTAWVGQVRYDVVRAVLASSCDDIAAVLQRIEALGAMDRTGARELTQAASVIERTANILKGVKEPVAALTLEEGRLTEPLERKLWEVYNGASSEIQRLIAARAYRDATVAYARAFAEPVHAFFEKVLVNADDQAVRRNRLALLHRINGLYTADVADLSQLVIETRTAQGGSAAVPAGRR